MAKIKTLLLCLSIATACILTFVSCDFLYETPPEGASTTQKKPHPETPAKPYEPIKTELAYALNTDGKTYSVSGIGTVTDIHVVIPSTYNGKPVIGIQPSAFWNCNSLVSITIPSSVTSIGGSAFDGCTSLGSIIVDTANTVYHSSGNCLIKTAKKHWLPVVRIVLFQLMEASQASDTMRSTVARASRASRFRQVSQALETLRSTVARASSASRFRRA